MKKLFTLSLILATSLALTGCFGTGELDAANSTIKNLSAENQKFAKTNNDLVGVLATTNKNNLILGEENKKFSKLNGEQADVIADQKQKIAALTASKNAEFAAKKKARGELQVAKHQLTGAKATAQAAVDRASTLEKSRKLAAKPALKKAS
jgi:PBP1b-binding outer membrane lipoprotein LpoB